MAECIANEDGERQIACAVAFQGEEMVMIPSFFLISQDVIIDDTKTVYWEPSYATTCQKLEEYYYRLPQSPW